MLFEKLSKDVYAIEFFFSKVITLKGANISLKKRSQKCFDLFYFILNKILILFGEIGNIVISIGLKSLENKMSILMYLRVCVSDNEHLKKKIMVKSLIYQAS